MATASLQDTFLNQVRKENQVITIFLINGVRVTGTVKGFDNFTVILTSTGKDNLIYKHAISTIIPAVLPVQKKEKPAEIN